MSKQTLRAKFLVQHSDGGRFRWFFWRDTRTPAGWMLETHDGVQRTLETNWRDSVPMIHQVAENYGCTCNIS